jgi:hypothetical protein
VTKSWAGNIDMTPDMIPVIGPVDEVQGLVVASGFSGHGFVLGPIAGKFKASGSPSETRTDSKRPSGCNLCPRELPSLYEAGKWRKIEKPGSAPLSESEPATNGLGVHCIAQSHAA